MAEEIRQSSGSTTASTVTVNTGVKTVDGAEVVCVCHQPGPEVIDVEQVLAAEMRQKVVEFDMYVPKQKPDIEQVIDVYVKEVEINSIDIIRDKVIIRGDLEVKVMYVAALPSQPVHAFERDKIKFTRDIDVDGAEPDMKATADVAVEYVDYDFTCCEPRKVHITIVLKFWTRVTTTTEMEVTAVTPVDQIGVVESMTASSSTEDYVSASQFTDDMVSAAQTGGGNFEQVGAGVGPVMAPLTGPMMETSAPPLNNVLVTEPLVPGAGSTMSVNGTVGTVTGNRVNVRSGPGTNYPSVTMVNKGTAVTIRDQAFGWYKVVLADGSTTGWIASWFVRAN